MVQLTRLTVLLGKSVSQPPLAPTLRYIYGWKPNFSTERFCINKWITMMIRGHKILLQYWCWKTNQPVAAKTSCHFFLPLLKFWGKNERIIHLLMEGFKSKRCTNLNRVFFCIQYILLIVTIVRQTNFARQTIFAYVRIISKQYSHMWESYSQTWEHFSHMRIYAHIYEYKWYHCEKHWYLDS